MIFKQFYSPCLAHASYIIGDEATGTAAVVDPQRDTEQYTAFAAEHGLAIKHVILTHLHADFVAGHLELRDRVGAAIYLGAAAKAAYRFTPLSDGTAIEMGRVRLEALETPGHTPESVSILVYDLDRGAAEPVRGVHRRHAVHRRRGTSRPARGAGLVRGRSGRHAVRLAARPSCWPYPTRAWFIRRTARGRSAERSLSTETVSTIGEQRQLNYALKPMTKEAFIELVTADQPDAPPYFTYYAVLNSQERPTLDEALGREMQPLALDRVVELQGGGAQVLDTREPEMFATAHLTGSINIGLSGPYATWAGTVLNHDHPIVIVANPGSEKQSAVRLGRIGFDNVVGYLRDGLRCLETRPGLTAKTERLSAPLAATLLASDQPPLMLSTSVSRPTSASRNPLTAA